MKVYTDFGPEDAACIGDSTITLGTFDGVHLGHRRILEDVRNYARAAGTRSVVVTFERHPLTVVEPASAPRLLTTLAEKTELVEQAGIDDMVVIRFTPQFARLSAEDFVRDHLVGCLAVRHMVVGYDHHFGRGAGGSHASLAELSARYGFTVTVTEPVRHNNEVVKSSLIRDLIAVGSVREAAEMLGRTYSCRGTVVREEGLGSRIGFPTANIRIDDPDKLLPADGVYSGWASFGKNRLPAVMSIGGRPTFNRTASALEVHIPGFTGDLYGIDMIVGFTSRIRDIIEFSDADELVRQIAQDVEKLHNRRYMAQTTQE